MPLIAQVGKFSAEAALKYFLVQAFASASLLLGILISQLDYNDSHLITELINSLIIFSVLVKIGAAPTHFWFPEVSNGLSWASNIILITWQKLGPFIVLLYLKIPFVYLILVVASSAIVGALGGFNQTSLRKILAFSSINHIAWILMGVYASQYIWSTYFLIYSIITIIIIVYFNNHNVNFIHQLYPTNPQAPLETFGVSLNMLSMGGLPPFLGFYPKWLVMEHIMCTGLFVIATYIIFITLIVLYFYIRITYPAFIIFNTSLKPKSYPQHSPSSLLVWVSVLGLAPAPLLIII